MISRRTHVARATGLCQRGGNKMVQPLFSNTVAGACLALLFTCPIFCMRNIIATTVGSRTLLTIQQTPASDDSSRSTTSPTGAQQSPSPSPNETPQTGSTKKPKKKNGGEIVIAPIPISSPAIGSGIVLALGYIFQIDKNNKTSAPSLIGVLGMRTNNGSRAVALGGSLHFNQDKYRIAFAAGRGDINVDFFGVGNFAAKRGIEVPLNFRGKGFLVQGLFRVHPDQVYVGARFQIRDLSAGLKLEDRAGVPAD